MSSNTSTLLLGGMSVVRKFPVLVRHPPRIGVIPSLTVRVYTHPSRDTFIKERRSVVAVSHITRHINCTRFVLRVNSAPAAP